MQTIRGKLTHIDEILNKVYIGKKGFSTSATMIHFILEYLRVDDPVIAECNERGMLVRITLDRKVCYAITVSTGTV